MKAKEIKEMTNDELVAKLDALKEELFNLRFRHATGQLENPNVLSSVKRISQELKPLSVKEN